MTLVPPGAQLAPVDLPPPPPQSDPREPSPTTVIRGRGASTPRKPHSPQPSRGTSPIRPAVPRAQSSEHSALNTPSKSGSPPLIAPTPLSFRQVQASGTPGSAGAGLHHPHSHSHSRSASPAGSMHSSTSAIFERDIEHPPVASLSLNPNPSQSHTLNHKSSRLSHLSHGSNLDHTVPAVLDDAVEALAGTSRGFQGLEIESPAPVGGGSGMVRQPSAQASARKLSSAGPAATSPPRSPSPISIVSGKSATSPTRSPPILGAISTNNPVGGTISPLDKSPASSFDAGNVPRPPMPGRLSTGPQLPGAWSFGREEDKSRKEEDKASTVPSTDPIAEAEVAPVGPATAVTTAEETSSSSLPIAAGNVSPAPAVPAHLLPADKRRISFISYNDLLSSAPTTVTNFGEITSGQLSPDHLPGTISPNVTSRSPVVSPSNPLGATSMPGMDHKSSWELQSGSGLGVGMTPAAAAPEGEWSREGLGKGLEQRLEDLVQSGKAA